VRNADPKELESRLPRNGALLEVREYRPLNLADGTSGAHRWAGVLMKASGEIVVRDLGSVSDTEAFTKVLLDGTSGPSTDLAARKLYQQLLAPFEADLENVDPLYVAPDGILYLVPFGALILPNGRRLLESKLVRIVQTGRDLLRPSSERVTAGLVAMGGIDFGEPIPTDTKHSETSPRSNLSSDANGDLRETQHPYGNGSVNREGSLHKFAALTRSRDEVDTVGLLYRATHPNEQVDIKTGHDATKAYLFSLKRPPRVLHLATHGFYNAAQSAIDRPMLLSGIALAGANQSDQDGILYAIELMDLNLEGTDLVVLSGCDTARGQIDYGEGISGLVRALRTAGARRILVTLRPVDDRTAAIFIELFYHNWLSRIDEDPAAALRETQREYLAPSSSGTADYNGVALF
jgi:CHAT domain-containing protein